MVGITLQTSADNKKVTASRMFTAGLLMKNRKEIKANRLFAEADKELRISYMIEESSVFTFSSGTMIGDYIEENQIDWEVTKKTAEGTSTIQAEQHGANKIGKFCLRPYLVALSASKVKITILSYPLTPTELETQHPHFIKAAFPGLELAQFELDFFPRASTETGKSWGCPIIPLFLLGGEISSLPNLPPTKEIKARISATLRTVVTPVIKRDIRTLSSAWTTIKESGPTALKEKTPDLLWPLWT